MSLPLEKGVQIRINRTYTSTSTTGFDSWEGQIANTDSNSFNASLNRATLVQRNNVITGMVRYNGQPYWIETAIKNQYHIIKLDPQKSPPQHPEYWQSKYVSSKKNEEISNSSTTIADQYHQSYIDDYTTYFQPDTNNQQHQKTVIKVIVPFTSWAANWATKNPAYLKKLPWAKASALQNMEGLIAVNEELANQSFRDSKIPVEIDIVHIFELQDRDLRLIDNLYALANKKDGHFDEVHTIRDKFGADLVVAFTGTGDVCGVADTVGAQEDEAFAILVSGWICTANYTFHHEIGHLMGSWHDQETNRGGSWLFKSYAQGFRDCKTQTKTIMAYACNKSDYKPRLNLWSDPSRLEADVYLGKTGQNNNVRLWQERAKEIANFRPDINTGTTTPTKPTSEHSSIEIVSLIEPLFCLGYFDNSPVVYSYNCSAAEFNTQWSYRQQQLQSSKEPRLCLTASPAYSEQHFYVANCKAENPSQQFQFFNNTILSQGYAIQVESEYYPRLRVFNGNQKQLWSTIENTTTTTAKGKLYRSATVSEICLSSDSQQPGGFVIGEPCSGAKRWFYENSLIKMAQAPNLCIAYNGYAQLAIESCNHNNPLHQWLLNSYGQFTLAEYPQWGITISTDSKAVILGYLPQDYHTSWQEAQ